MVDIEKKREQKRLANRKWMKNHPGRAAEVAKRYRENHPEMYAESRRRWLYGMNGEDFQARIEAQDSKCAICKQTFTKTPHVDHSHSTGENRGLLCSSCNLILGHAHDSEEILVSALEYLHRYTEQK